MGDFIATTMDLHKTYLERLEDMKAELGLELPAITGVVATPLLPFREAAGGVPGAEKLHGLRASHPRPSQAGKYVLIS
jgi:hypothetical protein